MNDDLATALFWAPIVFVFLLAFRHWMNNPPRDRMTWRGVDAEAAEELATWEHASYRNRSTWSALPELCGDYDESQPKYLPYDEAPFSLDYDVRAEA